MVLEMFLYCFGYIFLKPLNISNGTLNIVPLDVKGQPLPINQLN
jgi:hypothetical protein